MIEVSLVGPGWSGVKTTILTNGNIRVESLLDCEAYVVVFGTVCLDYEQACTAELYGWSIVAQPDIGLFFATRDSKTAAHYDALANLRQS